MTQYSRVGAETVIVEEEVRFSMTDLCRACRAERHQVVILVEEGVLEPIGDGPEDWRFSGESMRRARLALRLARDFDLSLEGTAVVIDLLTEIETLRSRLRRS
jgi:chaperone modulatory protein CbpM